MFNPLSDIPAYASVLSQTDTPSDTYHVTTQYNRDNGNNVMFIVYMYMYIVCCSHQTHVSVCIKHVLY